MKVNLAILALVLFGIFGHIYTYSTHDPTFICGTGFPISWVGGKLLGTPDLYTAGVVQPMQRELTGCTSDGALFIRLPFFAVMMWPFSLLPLGAAFWAYRGTLVLAELAFIATCGRHWKWALLACVWSFPLAYDLDNGHDISFLMLEVAAATWLLKRGRPFAAGLCLSLCSVKFHLMLFLPLALFWHSRRALAGMIAGGGALLVICFAAAGWDWPARYATAISNPRIDLVPLELQNIRGLVGDHLAIEAALSLTVAAAVWIACRWGTFEIALSAALAGGLLVSHHMTPCDWALLLPVGMMLGGRTQTGYIRYAAVLLASPVMVWLNGVPALNKAPHLILLSLAYALAWRAWSQRQQPVAVRVAAATAAS